MLIQSVPNILWGGLTIYLHVTIKLCLCAVCVYVLSCI